MKIVGAVSRAGETHEILFCEYTKSHQEDAFIDAFLEGLNVSLNRSDIYCMAVLSEQGSVKGVVGIYHRRDGKECMVYEKPYEYLTSYVSDIFSEDEELEVTYTELKGGQASDAKRA